MEYSQAEKTAKSFILARVMKMIRDNNPDQICFVKRDPKTSGWMSLPVGHARACVAQEFRDALHHSYRSSKHSKQRRRMQEKGYEFKEPTADHPCLQLDACNEHIPTENTSLLTGFVEGFHQSCNKQLMCEHPSLDQIRSLIHVPPRRSGFASEMVPSMRTNTAAPCSYRSQATNVASEYTASQLMGSMWRAQEMRYVQPSMEGPNTRFYGNGFFEPVARPELSASVRGNGAAVNHDSFDLALGDEGETDLYQPIDLADSIDLPMLNY
jgi:hypothetical protein